MVAIGVAGVSVIDNLLWIDRTSTEGEEELFQVNQSIRCAGGKGLLTATALTSLGHRCPFMSRKGVQSSLDMLIHENVDTSFVFPSLEHDNEAWITIDEDQKTRTHVKLSRPVQNQYGAYLDEFLVNLTCLYITHESVEVLLPLVAMAAAKEIPIVANLAAPLIAEGNELLEAIISECTAVVANEAESDRCLQVLGCPSWSALRSPKLREVVITRGVFGGFYAEPDSYDWRAYSAVQTKTCSVVGAGDAFAAGYLYSRWLHEESLADSCRYSAEVASWKVRSNTSALMPWQCPVDSNYPFNAS